MRCFPSNATNVSYMAVGSGRYIFKVEPGASDIFSTSELMSATTLKFVNNVCGYGHEDISSSIMCLVWDRDDNLQEIYALFDQVTAMNIFHHQIVRIPTSGDTGNISDEQ